MLTKMVVPRTFSIQSIIKLSSSLIHALISNDNIMRLEKVLNVSDECGRWLLPFDIIRLGVAETEDVRERNRDSSFAYL